MLTEWLKNNALTTDDIRLEGISVFPIQPFLGNTIGQRYKLSCVVEVYNGDKRKQQTRPLRPERVIFNPPATIVIWKDGTKTVVKAQEGDRYDRMTGVAMCYMKKALGNTSRAFNDALKAAGIGEGRE